VTHRVPRQVESRVLRQVARWMARQEAHSSEQWAEHQAVEHQAVVLSEDLIHCVFLPAQMAALSAEQLADHLAPPGQMAVPSVDYHYLVVHSAVLILIAQPVGSASEALLHLQRVQAAPEARALAMLAVASQARLPAQVQLPRLALLPVLAASPLLPAEVHLEWKTFHCSQAVVVGAAP